MPILTPFLADEVWLWRVGGYCCCAVRLRTDPAYGDTPSGRSIHAELVALDIGHGPTRTATIIAEPELSGTQRFQALSLFFIAICAHLEIEVNAIFHGLTFRNFLKKSLGPAPSGSRQAETSAN